MSYSLRTLLIVVLGCSAADAHAADGNSFLVQFADFKNITAALVSPDGRDIAYTVAITDLKANRVRTELWLIPLSKGEPRQLTFETDAIQKILWSPRGGEIAVIGTLAKDTGEQKAGTYLWLLNVASGKSRQLARIERSNHYLAHQGANLCWSGDGDFLAYLAVDAKPPLLPEGPIVVSRIQYKSAHRPV